LNLLNLGLVPHTRSAHRVKACAARSETRVVRLTATTCGTPASTKACAEASEKHAETKTNWSCVSPPACSSLRSFSTPTKCAAPLPSSIERFAGSPWPE
jgi:hypothetical protein